MKEKTDEVRFAKGSPEVDDVVCYVGMLVRTRPCLGPVESAYNFFKADVESKTIKRENGTSKYVEYSTNFGVFKQMLLEDEPETNEVFWGNCPYTAKNLQMMVVCKADDFNEDDAKTRLKAAFKQLAECISNAA